MDKSKFTEKAPGRLVPVALPASDWAFVPNALPPIWEFPRPKLWPLLVDAKEALGTLNGIGQTPARPISAPTDGHLQNREAITSSKIEGTYAVTPEQLLLYELDSSGARPRGRAHRRLDGGFQLQPSFDQRPRLTGRSADLQSCRIGNPQILDAEPAKSKQRAGNLPNSAGANRFWWTIRPAAASGSRPLDGRS